MHDVFDLSSIKDFSKEIFETIIQNEKVRIERIISNGQITPEDKWYNQEQNEWVLVLQGNAEILFENGEKTALSAGAYLLIPAHKRHKVIFTSKNPPCIWLAIFF